MKKTWIFQIVLFAIMFIIFVPETMALDYNNLCSSNDLKNAMKILGYVLQIIRWLIPMLLIIWGMLDFSKAVISNENDAIVNATKTLIRRSIAGIIIYFVPTIILTVLNIIEITNGVELENNTQFGQCTKCLFDPFNSCEIIPEKEINNSYIESDIVENDKIQNEHIENNSNDIQTSRLVLIAKEAEKIYNDSTFKSKFKYISPSAKNSDSIRARGYREAVTNASPTGGYYQADCNSFVGIVVKRATGLGGNPNSNSLGLGEITIAGPSGGTWVVRSFHKNNFKVVDKNLSLSNALNNAKIGDLLASNGDGSTHIQIYVGNNCVIGNTGGSKVITKRCNDDIPHNKGKFTIIRLK